MMLFLAMFESEEERSKMEFIYEKYSKEMHRQAYAILNDMDDAQDAVQNAMVSILRHLDKIQDANSNQTKWYALTAAQNAAKDIYRQKKRRWKEEVSIETELSDDSLSMRYEGENELLKQILNLSARDRNILIYKYVMGYDYSEISSMLGMSKEAVMKAGKRAKDRLERMVDKEEKND